MSLTYCDYSLDTYPEFQKDYKKITIEKYGTLERVYEERLKAIDRAEERGKMDFVLSEFMIVERNSVEWDSKKLEENVRKKMIEESVKE